MKIAHQITKSVATKLIHKIAKISSLILIAVLVISCESKTAQTNTAPAIANSNTTTKEPSTDKSSSRSGKFVSVAFPVTGQVNISIQGDKTILELDESFKTAPGPDLRIVFHKAPDLSSVAAPPDYGIDEADYIVIEKLKSNSGKQRYEIPKETKLDNFKSVAIWCAKMNKTYGFITLSQS